MDTPMLAAASRAVVGKKVSNVRRQRRIPSVIYGHGLTSVNLDVDGLAFQKVWRQAGSSSLVDLVVDNQAPVKVLIHAVQHHPTTSDVMHVDFYRVRMSEKLQTDIELNFVGLAPAVKERGGVLVKSLDKVKVECLPADLVPAIDVDVSGLKSFDDRLHVSDIAAPKGITIMDNPTEVVASVTPPRSESEIEALSGKIEEDVTTVAGVEKKEESADEDEGAGESASADADKKTEKQEKKPKE